MRLATSRNIYFTFPGVENRNSKMRGCAEAKETYAISRFNTGHSQTTETNNTGAEQRSGVQVIEGGRQRKAKILSGGGVFGIAAIDSIASEGWRIAEIFQTATAIPAGPVNAPDPGDANPRTHGKAPAPAIHHVGHDLMPGN